MLESTPASGAGDMLWGRLGLVGNSDSYGSSGSVKDSKGDKRDIFGVQRCSHDFFPEERCVWIGPGGSAIWHHGLQSVIRSWGGRWGSSSVYGYEFNSSQITLKRMVQEGPSLDESLENEEHLDVDCCDSIPLRMLQ
ncbi:hypothetical protein Tco_0868348 [Tanacetum coccineum]